MQIQLSENIFLTGHPSCFHFAEKIKIKGEFEIRPFKFFTSLESCFKEYLNMKIRNSKTVEFSELVLLHIEAIKEIKKCVRQMQDNLQLQMEEKCQNKIIVQDTESISL